MGLPATLTSRARAPVGERCVPTSCRAPRLGAVHSREHPCTARLDQARGLVEARKEVDELAALDRVEVRRSHLAHDLAGGAHGGIWRRDVARARGGGVDPAVHHLALSRIEHMYYYGPQCPTCQRAR